MPQLVEYVNKENLQPTDRGTDARVQEGRRIGAAYNQVAESLRDFGNRTGQNIGSAIRDAGDAAVAHVDHQQIAQGSDVGMKILASLTNEWNQKVSDPKLDPADPSIGPKFLEQRVGPTLDKFREGFTTEKSQQWAEHFIEGVRNHLYEKTTADMSSLAGIAVTGAVHNVNTTGSNTAMQDPSSVPFLIGNVDHVVDGIVGTSPTLKPTDAARVRTEVATKLKEGYVKAGAMGAIAKSSDPEATADEWVRKYPQYISGDEAKVLAQNARTHLRARDYDQRMKDRDEKEAQTEASNQKVNQYLIEIASKNPRLVGDPTAQKVLNDPDLTKADRGRLINYIARELKPETDARISAVTFNGLLQQLRDPNADAKSIMDKAWDARLTDAGKPGSLTQPDFDRIRKEIEDRKTPQGLALQQDRAEFFKKYERNIDVGMYREGQRTALGELNLYRAEKDAVRLEQTLKANRQDPHSLYDPASPNFFGKPENLAKYRSTLQQGINYQNELEKNPNAQPPSFDERFKGGEPVTPPAAAPSSGGSRWWPFGGSSATVPIKPPENREVGKVYDTPRGKLKWTGKPGAEWVVPKDEDRLPSVPRSE